jgi:hypothetical protein
MRDLGTRAELFAGLTAPEREQFTAILTRLTEAKRPGEQHC